MACQALDTYQLCLFRKNLPTSSLEAGGKTGEVLVHQIPPPPVTTSTSSFIGWRCLSLRKQRRPGTTCLEEIQIVILSHGQDYSSLLKTSLIPVVWDEMRM